MSAQFRIPTHPTSAVERARRLTQDYEASCVCASVKKWDLYGLMGYGHPSQNRTPMNAYVHMDKRIRDMAIAQLNGDISDSCCVTPQFPSAVQICKIALGTFRYPPKLFLCKLSEKKQPSGNQTGRAGNSHLYGKIFPAN